ncbi:ferrous iron transport protein B [Haliscomenobacter hydrossis]|uniref:Ferrous iron transport protein B n=1 Tax=Haliscomenobacter hydrossis (strain ATCC 27775 / DSM 1100 / LMG 10767 / O) TaxID=760192 RepID=F4KXE0_HALH1|nr:ferrous iron transport protein B [Haliscomenobacter hydrossis]AEE49348.1 ferrous iron transport protein B [Haliscomenobacter hydrossis DSM 1100]
MPEQEPKIALIGNPNSGKTSIFNQLTGLQQKVGNFPGVTVDKKTGTLELPGGIRAELIDLPGAYSFYPTSKDEKLVVQSLVQPGNDNYPDAIVYIADVTKLEKHLLLFSQLKDLGIPVVLALNMADVAEQEGLQYDLDKLSQKLGAPALLLSGRSGEGMNKLKTMLAELLAQPAIGPVDSTQYRLSPEESKLIPQLQDKFPGYTPYQLVLLAHHVKWLPFLSPLQKEQIEEAISNSGFQDLQLQVYETMQRYDQFTPIVQQARDKDGDQSASFTDRLDDLLTNRFFGPIVFFGLMLLIFHALFTWAELPMNLIEGAIGSLSTFLQNSLPEHWLTNLLTEGVLAGFSGIVVFIPQIAILFFLISLLEEVGYMARAAFMFDRIMQFFGLNGRSIVALISGGACAIPAIMSTRTISNWKERLITILVTPFISCSARIPVYTVLIGFVVPPTKIGFINLQALAFMGLYLLGIAAALLSALVFKLILRTNETSFLMLELPAYRLPVMRNVWLTVWEKVKTFTVEAGRIILIITIVLWVLSSFGPPGSIPAAETAAQRSAQEQKMNADETQDLVDAKVMEASFAGRLGKFIEPVIKPLGFDWKIGIALITSFAAREVFVATMATIYSIGHQDDEYSIREKMANQRDPVTKELVYTPATSLSLLLFYVFAMQCMSTIAVVRRETKSWKWPLIQFGFMTGLAYLSSWLAYMWLS